MRLCRGWRLLGFGTWRRCGKRKIGCFVRSLLLGMRGLRGLRSGRCLASRLSRLTVVSGARSERASGLVRVLWLFCRCGGSGVLVRLWADSVSRVRA